MDFTVKQYSELLLSLQHHANYRLRHDVDLRPEYALRIAKLEAEMGVKALYYFRAMHFDSHAHIIQEIASLGHEIGYHYESLATCNGDKESAYKDFCNNLEKLRKLAPVRTACAHGSPRSPWNSEELWRYYDRKSLGIEFEPMLDSDFSQTLYLTDTGRRWDGYRVAVRDKVPGFQEKWKEEGLLFHSTTGIIRALENPTHPIHRFALLISTHPQRWMPFGFPYLWEWFAQSAKNLVKRILVAFRG